MHTTCRLIVLLSVSCVYSIKMTPGSKAKFICSLEDVSVVTWYQQHPEEKPIAILTYNSKSFLPPKYLNGFTSNKMTPSSEASKLTLTIEEVTENDCGTYYCTKKVDDHFEFGDLNSLTCEDTSTIMIYSNGTETPMCDMTLPCEEDVTSWKYAVGGLLVVITLLLGLCMMLCIQTKEKKWTPDSQNQSCLKCTSRLD